VKDPVIEMFDSSYKGELNLSRLIYGMISLIPKLKEANNIKQFRPICFLGVDYKWITKVLTKRLASVADSVVNMTQTTFIPRRNILEGVVILHETMRELSRKKQKGVIIKLDFEKAYDEVSWPFLSEVLERKQFPRKWIEWIQQVVGGGRVGIKINGEVEIFFRTYKGVRQGDPLSPVLFNLVVDALATMLEKAKLTGVIKGLVPNLIEGGLTHLQYADDTIICLEVDDTCVENLKFILYCFEEMSELKIKVK
jgi:hypothetical protein